ncbi:MAG: altronate dehydratase family protein [Bacteroidota bacterium]
MKIHSDDNIAVALQDLKKDETVAVEQTSLTLQEFIPQKHKFTLTDLAKGDLIKMYGVTVGKVNTALPKGSKISTENTVHATEGFSEKTTDESWSAPDTSSWQNQTFQGYYRADGKVGTRNYWLVIPLVFCENRNVETLQKMLEEELGYGVQTAPQLSIQELISGFQAGKSEADLLATKLHQSTDNQSSPRIFPNVDGIKFLTHDGGCGGTRDDSDTLCRLLAGYITHPNVAGATVLSLGCQNAQIPILKEAIERLDNDFQKPIYFLEQQGSTSEQDFIAEAAKKTFVGCMKANEIERKAASLQHLCLGLECGGSDGFSGISANPALGHTSDLLVALGAKTILAEFPELNGVEQELINRCDSKELAQKFAELMQTYSQRAREVGSDFAWNPSPGNIKDGLITDAMKSAGAAKKGGTSPVVNVLDYTEQAEKSGLSLLCTPGNDVESTTGLAGSGANVIVFTTGLGTPTGNPISPVLKIASNSNLATRMQDIIDLDTGEIIRGKKTIEDIGAQLLDLIIKTASGEYQTKAERLGQDDFIPWKRGISL